MNCRFTVRWCGRYNKTQTTQTTFNERKKLMHPICPFFSNAMTGGILCFGIKVFLLIWIIFVPIAVTSRLEKIIKLLQEKK